MPAWTVLTNTGMRIAGIVLHLGLASGCNTGMLVRKHIRMLWLCATAATVRVLQRRTWHTCLWSAAGGGTVVVGGGCLVRAKSGAARGNRLCRTLPAAPGAPLCSLAGDGFKQLHAGPEADVLSRVAQLDDSLGRVCCMPREEPTASCLGHRRRG